MNGTLELTVPSKESTIQKLINQPADVSQLDTAKPLAEIFQPFQTVLEKWEAKAAALVVTDISQKTEMQQARLARLELKEARVTMDKTRKGLVEGLKARTGKIDETARVIRVKIEGLEESLRASEEFAERHAEKLKAELKVKREAELQPLMDTPILGDLSDLSEADYAKALADAKMLRQAKIDAAAKAESDRLAREAADRAERERIAAENARLKAEAAETARLAEIERQRVEAERAAERKAAQAEADRLAAIAKQEREAIEAKAKAEAERLAEIARKQKEESDAKAAAAEQEAAKSRAELAAKLKAEADEKARVEAERLATEKAAKKAAAAPDKAKLIAFGALVRAMVVPELENNLVRVKLLSEVDKLADWAEEAAENL